MAIEVPFKKLRYYWPAYLLIAVPLLLVLVFNYHPIVNGMWHMFYRWDGDTVEEFVGFQNIVRMWRDSSLLHSFFVDAGQWNVSLAFDGVHFTEAGHCAFAEELWQYLMSELGAVTAGE